MSEVRFALSVPNFAEPSELVELGVRAERAGWHGVLLWDHLFGGPGFAVPMADPWVVLGALAVRTERIRLGTAITPLARRRPQKVARESVSVDRLSVGRMVLGVGLGSPAEEYTAFHESADPHVRSAKLDEALEVLTGLWSGEPFDHHGPHYQVAGAQFLPEPLQRPRIPIWTACATLNDKTLARAARWDGVVLAKILDGAGIGELSVEELSRSIRDITRRRGSLEGFDVAVLNGGIPSETTLAGFAEVGATWVLVTGWMDQLHELAAAGPVA